MAIEDWCHWDVDDWDGFGYDTSESVPFACKCKWCGKGIIMTPAHSGWRPMSNGKLHICKARKAAQAKALLAAMPDLSLPECQFCGENMVWRKGEIDYDESWFPHFFLCCPKCGATGPRVDGGHPDYERLLKEVK